MMYFLEGNAGEFFILDSNYVIDEKVAVNMLESVVFLELKYGFN